MNILITGGTGLIGRALCRFWAPQGHELHVWSREPLHVSARCGAGVHGVARLQDLDGSVLDAVVNLAGAPIADRRWSAGRQRVLEASRIDLTRTLVDWMAARPQPPRALVSGSATGVYGDRGDAGIDEDAGIEPTDFGSRLCLAWEGEARRAESLGTRVACVRTAPVLAYPGGMLDRLLPAYRLGLGGRLGSGRQWFPWIHLDDEVRLIDFLVRHPTASGAFNASAPQPVRQAEFAQALAAALHRPAPLAVPAWLLRALLGEMAVLLLGGQCALPEKAQAAGFRFRHQELAPALAGLLAGR